MLSVAIINYETAELTRRCVRSILDAPPAEAYEVVVVDNGSSPADVAALRGLDGVRLVETGVNGGFAVGVNRCMAAADAAADVVVLLNSDTEVLPGALEALAAAARAPGVGMAAPVLLERDGRVQRSAHRRFPTLWSTWVTVCAPLGFLQRRVEPLWRHPSSFSVAEHEAGGQPLHVTGAAMAVGRDAWAAIGPFDERYFMYLEETEWQLRLHRAGWRVELVPAARVRHLHRGGETAIAVPPLVYFDSVRTYFRALGRSDRSVRAVLASALAVSYVALLAYAPLTRWAPTHRAVVRESLPLAWAGLLHVLHGHAIPRPPR